MAASLCSSLHYVSSRNNRDISERVKFTARKAGVTIYRRFIYRLRRGCMPVSAYWGYRGPRRKSKPQQPRLLTLLPPPPSFLCTLLFPRPFSRLSLFFGTWRTLIASVFREEIPSFHRNTAREAPYTRDGARRKSYILSVHTGRIPDADTYNRRKIPTSVPVSMTEHSRRLLRTDALNHYSRELSCTEEVPCMYLHEENGLFRHELWRSDVRKWRGESEREWGRKYFIRTRR